MKRRFSTRSFVSVIVGVLALVGASAAMAALSHVSPGKVEADTTMLYWTGQGADANFGQCGGTADPGAGGYQNGATANDYMLWIFATDGGSLPANTPPTLTINGVTYGSAYQPKQQDAQYGFPGAWQIVTPFIDPTTITRAIRHDQSSTGSAFTSFTVNETGSGSWILTISHGCGTPTTPGESSTINTEVHSGATDSGSAVVVDDNHPAALGDHVHDSAHAEFTGSNTQAPAGSSVEFFFWNNHTCSDDPADSSGQISVTGGSPVDLDPELAEGPLGAGEYSYAAVFHSGDETLLSSSESSCEPLKVNKGNTSSSTTIVRNDTSAQLGVDPVPHVPLGTIVHDTASVGTKADSISMAGTLTYHFYTGTDCNSNNEVGTAESVSVDADGIASSSSNHGPLEAGNYSFNASYSGNNDYNGSGLSSCEPLIVDKANTSSSTTIVRNDTNAQLAISPTPHVPLGTTVHDTASVGTKADSISMAGTLTYHFYTGTACDSTKEVGTGESKAVDADGNAASSSDHGPLGAGGYSFNASYTSGNNNYNDSGLSTCEPLIVDKGTLTIATKIHDANHNVVTSVLVGASVHDTAQLSGANANFAPDTSKVSFKWFATGSSCPDGTSTSVANVGADQLTGDPRSAAKGPLALGSFAFNASFAGDSNYLPAGPSGCEPLGVFNAALTPGYWKNHLANSSSKGPFYSSDCKNVSSYGGSCSTQGVWSIQYLSQGVSLGNFVVSDIVTAAKVFNAMNCGASTDQSAIGCLSGHLLAAKLNLANGSQPTPCIVQAVSNADAFLKGQIVNGVTGVNYTGPTWSGTLSAAQRSLAISIKTKLDSYNNGSTSC